MQRPSPEPLASCRWALALLILGGLAPQPGSAQAQPPADQPPAAQPEARGAYVTIGAGAGWPQPVQYSGTQAGGLLPIEGTVQNNPGFAGELGLGYDFGSLRTEISWVHRQTSVESSTWSAGPYPLTTSGGDGQVSSNSGFASLYVDLPVNARLVPYVGAGLGYTRVSTNPTTVSFGAFSQSVGGGTNGLFGYQAKAGLAYQASPHTDLFAEAVYQGAPGRSQGSFDRSAFSNWGLRLGVRLRFKGTSLPQP